MSTLFKRYLTLEKDRPKDIQLVPFDTLEGLFRDKLDNLDSEYVEGCLEWVSEAHPELYLEAQEAERQVDMVWLDVLAGKASLAGYERALTVWHKAYLKCFTVYGQRPKSEQGGLFNH